MHILCTCSKHEQSRKQYFSNSQLITHIIYYILQKSNISNYLTDIILLIKLQFF